MKRIMFVAPISGACALFGCASYAAPHQHLADSAAAIRAAEELGAAAQPQAALNLKLAKEEVSEAKGLISDGKNEQADFMAMRAKADADLATALAKEQASRARAAVGETHERAVQNGATVLPVAPPPSSVLPASPSTVTPGGTR